MKKLICDTCKTEITQEHRPLAFVTWTCDDKGAAHSFRVEHHRMHSPFGGRRGCYLNEATRFDFHIGNRSACSANFERVAKHYQHDETMKAVLFRVLDSFGSDDQ
jgi:hypothetical protein